MNMSIEKIVIFILCFIYNFTVFAQDHSTMQMQHKQVEISEGVLIPQINISLTEDTITGFNLHIDLINYQIESPVYKNPPVKNTINGHAHLFINGKKVTRLYGNDLYINADLLNPGVNIVAVTLNSHGHDTWTYKERPITASVTLDTRKDNPVIHSFSSSPLNMDSEI